MEILTVHQTKSKCYKKARTAKHVGILVHSTGAKNKTLKRWVDAPERLGKNLYNNHWNKSTATKAVHAFIGYDKGEKIIVAETIPYSIACWGCGSGKNGCYNYNPVAHIQFEICQGSNTDSEYYWKVIEVAEEYCAYLCNKFGWTVDKITSHKEAHKKGYASNHGDPQNWMKHFGDDMDKFRKRVEMRLNGSNFAVDAPLVEDKQDIKETPKTPINANEGVKTVTVELLTLKNGSIGNQVSTLQRLLNALGYKCGTVDAKFGVKTEYAVVKFQEVKGLDPDGIVGAKTWNALLK